MTSNSHADLSWLPSDNEEQLSLSFRIITNAYKTRVNSLEAEIRSLKSNICDKSEQIQLLSKKQNSTEVQLIEETQRANQLSDENKQLISTIRKLNKDLHKLETFKRNVEASIKEEVLETDDAQRVYCPEDILQSAAPRTMQELAKNESYVNSWPTINGSLVGNAITTGNQFPLQDSKFSECRNYENKGLEHKFFDAKAFFKAVRFRLSTEQFNLFIYNIKKLNAHQQTKDETLKNAATIFGDANSDLYEDFKLMLTKT